MINYGTISEIRKNMLDELKKLGIKTDKIMQIDDELNNLHKKYVSVGDENRADGVESTIRSIFDIESLVKQLNQKNEDALIEVMISEINELMNHYDIASCHNWDNTEYYTIKSETVNECAKIVASFIFEKCNLCNSITTVRKDLDIYSRQHYIEGAGQLCESCYTKTY